MQTYVAVHDDLRPAALFTSRDGVKRAEIARRLGLSRQWVTKIIKISSRY
ncbi:helix-turn-helix domain-containing protein, partial [Sutterella seckii]